MAELGAAPALVEYFVRGGSWMWALLACSVIALAVITYKSITLWLAGRGSTALVEESARLIQAGQIEKAALEAKAPSSAVAAVLASIFAAAESGYITPREAA